MEVMFLRRGLDSKAGGAHAVFTTKLNFDYFPVIWNIKKKDLFYSRTYSEIGCRLGGSLANYLPNRLKNKIPHINPNFTSNTFYSSNSVLPGLKRLKEGDIIVFYQSMNLFTINYKPSVSPDGLFIIGFFQLEKDSLYFQKNTGNQEQVNYITRRFRGHPLLDYNDPKYWDKNLFDNGFL